VSIHSLCMSEHDCSNGASADKGKTAATFLKLSFCIWWTHPSCLFCMHCCSFCFATACASTAVQCMMQCCETLTQWWQSFSLDCHKLLLSCSRNDRSSHWVWVVWHVKPVCTFILMTCFHNKPWKDFNGSALFCQTHANTKKTRRLTKQTDSTFDELWKFRLCLSLSRSERLHHNWTKFRTIQEMQFSKLKHTHTTFLQQRAASQSHCMPKQSVSRRSKPIFYQTRGS